MTTSVVIASWNVNSVRARKDLIINFLNTHAPDIVLLQETKVEDESFPDGAFEELGYTGEVFGEKRYNGVAILSRWPISAVERHTFETQQARYIQGNIKIQKTACVKRPPFSLEATCPSPPLLHSDSRRKRGGSEPYIANPERAMQDIFEPQVELTLASVYVPNGQCIGGAEYEKKLRFLGALQKHTKALARPGCYGILGGDFNITTSAQGIGHPHFSEGGLFSSPQERAFFCHLNSQGWVESRNWLQSPLGWTWWPYQGNGWQKNWGLNIDHIWVSPWCIGRLQGAGVWTHWRGDPCTISAISKKISPPHIGQPKNATAARHSPNIMPKNTLGPSDHAPVWLQLTL